MRIKIYLVYSKEIYKTLNTSSFRNVRRKTEERDRNTEKIFKTRVLSIGNKALTNDCFFFLNSVLINSVNFDKISKSTYPNFTFHNNVTDLSVR